MSEFAYLGDPIFAEAEKQGWPAARMAAGRLEFSTMNGFDRALQTGFFFIKQPDPQISLEAGDSFARRFYLGSEHNAGIDYRRLISDVVGAHQGYFARTNDQTEQFFLESKNWGRFYPAPLCRQAVEMRDFAIKILLSVLDRLQIAPDLYDRATGGAISAKGTHTLTFNHFRPAVSQRGLNVHKDSGWVTLLRSLWRGLEVEFEGDWKPINPIEGTFIVNFGCAFEILTRRLKQPVSAASHRVMRQVKTRDQEDRFSYAMFIDSSLSADVSEGLFELSECGELSFVCDFNEFLASILDNTYKRHGKGLY
jgi:hypothetical protein